MALNALSSYLKRKGVAELRAFRSDYYRDANLGTQHAIAIGGAE
jgi:hypothetical protein